MKEVIGNLFTYNPIPPITTTPNSVEELLDCKSPNKTILRCVTTNGVVNKYGSLVMGAGIAKAAKKRFMELPHLFGQRIDERGLHVHVIEKYGVASLPTKYHWKDDSDLNLIIKSCRELVFLTKKWDFVLLPPPGCTNGGLVWDEVRPHLKDLLVDDKFVIVHAYNYLQ
tara:strand:- start:224 stop:730 length:507 start_codon:yes stop_codon:yes gene_type:complete